MSECMCGGCESCAPDYHGDDLPTERERERARDRELEEEWTREHAARVETARGAASRGQRVEFRYRREEGFPAETRRGVAVCVTDSLLFTRDDDRDGAHRSFRLDSILSISVVDQPAPKPWGNDPFAGFDQP